MNFRSFSVLLFAALAAMPGLARASCGSATCPIDPQSLNLPAAGQGTLDLSFQYIDQDRLQHGRREVSRPEPPEEGELEIRTVNRITTLVANFAATRTSSSPGLSRTCPGTTNISTAASTGPSASTASATGRFPRAIVSCPISGEASR